MTVFGLQWTQATDAYVRPAESVLTHKAVTAPTNAETLAAVAQASTYAPWSGMRRCNLWDDGTPTAYYNDRCFTNTDVANMGQCMVQIPKFWYCTDHGGGVYKWWISDTGADAVPAGADGGAWKVHPAFIRNGVTKSYIYLGAYEAYLNGTKFESVSGFQPTTSQTMVQCRLAARLRKDATGTTANYWELQDYLTTSAVQLLYLVEYGNFNSQVVLGAGITNITTITANESCNTGHTTTLGNVSGQSVGFAAEHEPATTVYAMSYRGIENIYGNVETIVDGINIKTNRIPYIADHDFVSNIWVHPYTASTATPLYNATAYIGDILADTTYDYLFLSSAAGASATTKLCDLYTDGAADQIVSMGGYWGSTVYAGLFACNMSSTSVTNYKIFGSRLMYIG